MDKVEKPEDNHVFVTNNEEVYETSLLFDPTTINSYKILNMDNHKVNQQLETEMLSDEKTHFTHIFSNQSFIYNLQNLLVNIDFAKRRKSFSCIKSDFFSNEEMESFCSTSLVVKDLIDVIENVKEEVRKVKDSWLPGFLLTKKGREK